MSHEDTELPSSQPGAFQITSILKYEIDVLSERQDGTDAPGSRQHYI